MLKELAVVFVLIALVLVPVKLSYSGEEIKEMSMATDVGEVILTLEPCPINPNHGFPYLAYATEKGQPDHLGCWFEPEGPPDKPRNEIINIWFPEISAIASYHKHLFKPRTKL